MSSDATDNTMRAEFLLKHGQDFPYAAISDPDWADRAALAIASDLCDRRGIKWEMEKVDDDVRPEIVTAHAAIIRVALPGWMPIETAPRDGTRFLGHRDGKIGVAQNMDRDDGEAWTFAGSTAHVEFFPEVKPTHWMPLPAPPIDNSAFSKPDRAPSEDGYRG